MNDFDYGHIPSIPAPRRNVFIELAWQMAQEVDALPDSPERESLVRLVNELAKAVNEYATTPRSPLRLVAAEGLGHDRATEGEAS
jgi:hypothetical protein